MAGSSSNLWPWQQQEGMPPALPKKPPARPEDEGELYGKTAGDEDVPVSLQRSLGYGAHIEVKARPVDKEARTGALPWSDTMQARAQDDSGGVPVPQAVQPVFRLKPYPKAPPSVQSDPFSQLMVVKKKQDPSLVLAVEAANMYEIGLIEQHGLSAAVARQLTVQRFQEGYFALSKMRCMLASSFRGCR